LLLTLCGSKTGLARGRSRQLSAAVLASWYDAEHTGTRPPLVLVLEDADACAAGLLTDYVLMLRYGLFRSCVSLSL
jgi:hypothetical protein